MMFRRAPLIPPLLDQRLAWLQFTQIQLVWLRLSYSKQLYTFSLFLLHTPGAICVRTRMHSESVAS